MDGLSLDGIMGMLRSLLPMIAYYLDMASQVFDVFTAYIGLGVFTPEKDDTNGGAATE